MVPREAKREKKFVLLRGAQIERNERGAIEGDFRTTNQSSRVRLGPSKT